MPRVLARTLANDLRTRLSHETTFGAWCATLSPTVVESFASADCDWVLLDLQHSVPSGETLPNLIRAGEVWHLPMIVRPAWNDPALIMSALDAGAAGIVAPMINSAEEAERFIQWAKYAPRGARSWGPVIAVGSDDEMTPTTANRSVLCIAMVETQEAVTNLAEILEVDGIDGIFIGPSDLSIDYTGENFGDGNRAEMEIVIAEVLHRSLAAGKFVGITTASGEIAAERAAQGFRFLPAASDIAVLRKGSAALLATARGN